MAATEQEERDVDLTPLTIVKLTKTCDGAPSQWEGRLSNGDDIYIRYRYGGLSVRAGADILSDDSTLAQWDAALIFAENPGHMYDSAMESSQMLDYLRALVVLGDGVQVAEIPYP